MLRRIAVPLIVIAAALAIAATRTAGLRVEHSTRNSSPPGKIFQYVNDLHRWGV